MVDKNFAEEMAVLLHERLGGVDIRIQDITKNNGVVLTGIRFQKQDENIAPCIYLEGVYLEYQNGRMGMEEAAGEIILAYSREHMVQLTDVEEYLDYPHICHRLYGRLVNTEKNEKLLEHVPHRNILDLSLVYHIEVLDFNGSGGSGYIRVENGHMQMWGVCEEELYGRAVQNMQEEGRACIFGMADVLRETAGIPSAGQPDLSAYILTNSSKTYGAAQLINQKALEMAAELLDSDFYILPSSVHETILLPVSEWEDGDVLEYFVQTVQDVNNTMVPEEEFLSSHVYRYCTDCGQIRIAA